MTDIVFQIENPEMTGRVNDVTIYNGLFIKLKKDYFTLIHYYMAHLIRKIKYLKSVKIEYPDGDEKELKLVELEKINIAYFLDDFSKLVRKGLKTYIDNAYYDNIIDTKILNSRSLSRVEVALLLKSLHLLEKGEVPKFASEYINYSLIFDKKFSSINFAEEVFATAVYIIRKWLEKIHSGYNYTLLPEIDKLFINAGIQVLEKNKGSDKIIELNKHANIKTINRLLSQLSYLDIYYQFNNTLINNYINYRLVYNINDNTTIIVKPPFSTYLISAKLKLNLSVPEYKIMTPEEYMSMHGCRGMNNVTFKYGGIIYDLFDDYYYVKHKNMPVILKVKRSGIHAFKTPLGNTLLKVWSLNNECLLEIFVNTRELYKNTYMVVFNYFNEDYHILTLEDCNSLDSLGRKPLIRVLPKGNNDSLKCLNCPFYNICEK